MDTVLTDGHVQRETARLRGNAHHPMKGVVSPAPSARRVPAAGPSGTAGAFPDFTYNGGPVIETPQVFAMFIGDWTSSADQTRVTRLQHSLRICLAAAT